MNIKNCFLSFMMLLCSISVFASEVEVIEIRIKNHQFEPNIIKVAPAVRVKLIVYNDDDVMEEFESHDLKREKIIPAGKKAIIPLRKMKRGVYSFFGEFHPETAQGKIIVE